MNWQEHKKLITAVLFTFFMFFILFSWTIYSIVNAPMISQRSLPLIITLDKTASASQFARLLKAKGLISSTKLFLFILRLEGLANHLKAGVYQVKPGETALQLLDRVVQGDVIVLNFPIIAGTTQQKIAHDLAQAHYLEYHPEDWASIKDNYPNLEGLVLADTYQYRGGSNSKALLAQAHKSLLDYLALSWANKASDLPYKNPYELLIAASIIEKETAISDERKLISGVLINRLRYKMPLQMDPTVIYGLGNHYKGKLSHNDMLIDSPYNSYRYRGLPPTPIATVGRDAIDAAAHPFLSKYLYFVAKGDGTHQFSETYEQQRQAINQYQRKDY